MNRGIYTKWIIGLAFLLLIVAVGCILYYQHTTAPYKAEVEKATPPTPAETESTNTPAERTTPTAEKSIPKTSHTMVKMTVTGTPTQPQTQASVQTAKTEEVPVSPFGFGPYPEIPDDYPTKHNVSWSTANRQMELLNRVLISLWTEGQKNFHGGGTYKGKVYPHYFDTVYIGVKETVSKAGSVSRTTYRLSGPFVKYSLQELKENPPPHIRILDLETSGIDPYQYLDLP